MLTLSGVSKSFPGVRALHDVSLSLYPGQVTALIGENGAGKSTLVKILTGIYQPDAGDDQRRRQAGFAAAARTPPSSTASPPSTRKRCCSTTSRSPKTSFSAMRRARASARSTGAPCAASAREVLDAMHAGHIDADARLRDLGIANKHLVAVARAMSIDAQIVIMDEPTAALSAKEIEELFLLDRAPEGRRQGDPVHQPQVRRDLPHRRPLHRVPRRRDGGRGADRRRRARTRSSG